MTSDSEVSEGLYSHKPCHTLPPPQNQYLSHLMLLLALCTVAVNALIARVLLCS